MEPARYKMGDKVIFAFFGEEKHGEIAIVDHRGTFFQTEEPSYDIWVETDNGRCLCKHIRQSAVRLEEEP